MKVQLGGVPETLLWTLYHRSIEARRPDAILTDPRAVALVDEIDYPFAERFGSGEGGLAQWQALRFRIEVRERLLPAATASRWSPARRSTRRGMDAVDPSRGLLITAQGLLMYFEFEDVERLLAACARRFPTPRSSSWRRWQRS